MNAEKEILKQDLSKQEKPEDIKKFIEDTELMGGHDDIVELAKAKYETALEKINTSVETTENEKNKATELGGSEIGLQEATAPIDKKITEKDKEIQDVKTETEQKIGVLKNEGITTQEKTYLFQSKVGDDNRVVEKMVALAKEKNANVELDVPALGYGWSGLEFTVKPGDSLEVAQARFRKSFLEKEIKGKTSEEAVQYLKDKITDIEKRLEEYVAKNAEIKEKGESFSISNNEYSDKNIEELNAYLEKQRNATDELINELGQEKNVKNDQISKSDKAYFYNLQGSGRLEDAINTMIELAKEKNANIKTEFNKVEITVRPGDNIDSVQAEYEMQYLKNRLTGKTKEETMQNIEKYLKHLDEEFEEYLGKNIAIKEKGEPFDKGYNELYTDEKIEKHRAYVEKEKAIVNKMLLGI